MTTSINAIARAIYEYKRILKKNMPATKYSSKIKRLGINRMQLKKLDESEIFRVASLILKDLSEQYDILVHSSSLYSGIHEFYRHLKSVLSQHSLERGRIIKSSREASHAMVDLVQIISLNRFLDNNSMEQLRRSVDTISKYGTLEQIQSVVRIIKDNCSDESPFYNSLLLSLESKIQKHVAVERFFSKSQNIGSGEGEGSMA